MTPTSSRSSVTVAVCTFRRNDLLAALVRRVDELATDEVPDGSVRMLIVDDSPDGGAADTVNGLRREVAIELDYELSGAADISAARNRALTVSSTGSDFVACLDDDCVPNASWLRELLRIANEHSADIVIGHRQFVAAPDAPRWLHDQPFLAENISYADGSVPTRGNTANMLIRSSWLQSSGVRFRTEMGAVGGEDMVFLADATSKQANIRFAAASICDEPCDGRRATFRYQAWRQVWLGNNEAIINRTTHEASPARLVARAIKRTVLGAVHPFVRLARRKSPQVHWSLALTGRGLGLLFGVAGVRIRHRS